MKLRSQLVAKSQRENKLDVLSVLGTHPPSPALFHFEEIESLEDTLKGSEKKHGFHKEGKTEADECLCEGVSLGLRRFGFTKLKNNSPASQGSYGEMAF